MHGKFFVTNTTCFTLSIMLAFTFFAGGCHTGNELVPTEPAAVKKAEADTHLIAKQNNKTSQKKIPGTLAKSNASGILLSEAENDAKEEKLKTLSSKLPEDKAKTSATSLRDPFAIPEEFRKKPVGSEQPQAMQAQYASLPPVPSVVQNGNEESKSSGNPQPIPHARYQQNAAVKATVPQYAQATVPVLSGIFDNGKEKYILLHWNQIQGVFQNGETLPNGYRVEEITGSTATLRPAHSGSNIVLTLH